MKKIIGIVLTVIALLAMTVPAMASSPGTQSVTSQATVGGGTGSAPTIICKWETSDNLTPYNNENGDANHLKNGTQVDPVITLFSNTHDVNNYGYTATVWYWVLVKGEVNAHDNVGEVAVNVYEPNDFTGATMNGKDTADGYADSSANYSYKYKVVLSLVADSWQATDPVKTFIKTAVTNAKTANLLTLNPSYTLNDITGDETVGQALVKQGKVRLYLASAVIKQCQTGGIYQVQAFAYDVNNATQSAILLNCFDFDRTIALDRDFDNINYQTVQKDVTGSVCGDNVLSWNDGLPTMKSGGNTALDVSVLFSDMYATIGGVQMPMQEVKFDAYLFDESNAVVEPTYARSALDVSHPDSTHLWLPICTPEKVGFSIHVHQAQAGSYSGTVTITGTDNGIPFKGVLCTDPACPNVW